MVWPGPDRWEATRGFPDDVDHWVTTAFADGATVTDSPETVHPGRVQRTACPWPGAEDHVENPPGQDGVVEEERNERTF